MRRRARNSLAQGADALDSVVEELSRASSAVSALDGLKTLNMGLADPSTTEGLAPASVALLLPCVIRLLRGNPTAATLTDADMRSAISGQAGELLDRLVSQDGGLAQLVSATCITSPLIKALRDAPNVVSSIAAARALKMLAETQKAECRALAKAGVMQLMLAFLNEVGVLARDREKLAPVWDLANLLLHCQPFAVRDLKRAISGSQTDLIFIALNVLQVGYI
jgi:hypothetical protein